MSALRLGPVTIASALGSAVPTAANSSSRPGRIRSSRSSEMCTAGRSEARVQQLASKAPVRSGAIQQRAGWRGDFEKRLLSALPGSEIVGLAQPRLWNTVSALMPESDGQQRWVVKLDKLGFAVSTGSACSSGKEEPSHVIAAMGYSPQEAARVLRFSSGWETSEEDWRALLEGLENVNRGVGNRSV